MCPDNNVRHLTRPSEDPNHPNYGPCRRLGVMFAQIFADQPQGFEGMEKKLLAFQDASVATPKPLWDEHLHQLIVHGCSEADAQRVVMQQMLYAHQWIS